jgi:hypothetical protein
MLDGFLAVRDMAHARAEARTDELTGLGNRRSRPADGVLPGDLHTAREVAGAGALIRWQHPTQGLLNPDAFVQIVENHSLMPILTRHVLRNALVQCRQWRVYDDHATVAVNLSATSLLDEGLIDDVVTALDLAGVPAGALVLEITETMLSWRRVSKTPKRPGSSARWAATSCRAITTVAPGRPRAVWRV